MISDIELERLFAEWETPAAGRAVIRDIRSKGPVRTLQYRMDGVRTRFISKKMERALYAESRTCELPALYIREHDPETVELWPQPYEFDLEVEGPRGGKTRLQHTPDLFLIEHGFIIEEWREEARLRKLAAERPHHFYKDDQGRWHYVPFEQHLAKLGIEYRLRSSDEHPRVFLSNLSFLEEYSLEDTPVVPGDQRQKVVDLLAENNLLPHLSLVVEHGIKADHVFQLVLDGTAYVDLHETLLRKTDELIIYRDEAVGDADALFRASQLPAMPDSALQLSVGTKFLYEDQPYEVVLLGKSQIVARGKDGATTELPLKLVKDLFDREMLSAQAAQPTKKEFDTDELLSNKRLGEAIERLQNVKNPEAAKVSDRTIRRWNEKLRGIAAPQDQLDALMSRNPGNREPRLPAEVLKLAQSAVDEFHNQVANPTTLATYNFYIEACGVAGVKPMSRSSFYGFVARNEDVAKREGKRKAYQKAPIPLSYDFMHPVHGVLPHEVCYCDHTILNVFLKGSVLPDLGKPTISVMVDGALSKPRAFYLSYQPASAISVLMCLRDYVRRNGRLPRILVLDNGREFHSEALKLVCSLFNIAIRWRRRSRPRDSAIVERMLGATEKEVLAQLDGNSLALKDPRMVSSTHLPQKHIEWTLPGLHGAIEHFLFEAQPNRKHPRFGISPNDYEKRLLLECGAREHVFVRYDTTLRMLTAPHSGKPTRQIDRQRGVYVDGMYYWHDKLALAKRGEACEVRIELWRARVVYVNFRGEWFVAVARDGGELEGRYRPEFELQQREETRRRKTLAQDDKVTPENSRKRMQLWEPGRWDERLRDQMAEMYLLYDRLEMTEVLPAAKNPNGHDATLAMPKGTALDMIYAVQGETDAQPVADEDAELERPSSKGTSPGPAPLKAVPLPAFADARLVPPAATAGATTEAPKKKSARPAAAAPAPKPATQSRMAGPPVSESTEDDYF
jgi:putative transposase